MSTEGKVGNQGIECAGTGKAGDFSVMAIPLGEVSLKQQVDRVVEGYGCYPKRCSFSYRKVSSLMKRAL